MATSEGVEESLDFDFFETPRHQNEDFQQKPPKGPERLESEDLQKSSKNNHSPKQDKSAKCPSGRKSTEIGSASGNYCSDSASESDAASSGDKREAVKLKKKTKSRSSPSNSSLSSLSSNNSFSRRSRSFSKSGSDSEQDGSNRSVSNSSLSSNSDTEQPTNANHGFTQGSSMPKRGQSRIGEDEYSSSAYSEGENSSNMKSPMEESHPKDSVKNEKSTYKQAWGENSALESKGSRRDTKPRPKTAKPGAPRSTPASRNRRRQGSPSKSDSETLSDSDITDVSPMDSPRPKTRTSGTRGSKGQDNLVSSSGDGAGDKMQKFLALPVNHLDLDDDGGDELKPPKHRRDGGRDASGFDLDILMKAVGELEKQKRVQANSRRVMFAPMGASREKNNYTFDQTKARDIERENQRLLNEIVRRVNSTADQKKQFYSSSKPAYKLTPSAINRERDMKRIESENMAFLKRLQKVKPTAAICRDHQLKSYENTTLHGVSIAALHPLPGCNARGTSETSSYRRRAGASSVADSASSIGSRTRSMTSIHSGISSVRSSKRGSRPSSATVRPGSATKRLDTRPEWNDRW
ncbi:cilia- and flagella-associated protein 97-like [Elysia marginata]|uniref:Cilia- and flagella-associated protein 97-like n=1 Tax=Elysia marginata TaxID=1093978 RepID=A0AAV4JVA3_9GAST|nr:cilia- and flagella-associated protein 97-like [Elysia marginata]